VQRRERAQMYTNLLGKWGESVFLPVAAPWAKAIYHLYVIRVEDRNDLIAKLAADNIGTGIHYPIPLHIQKAYGYLGLKEGDFPVSEGLAREIVSLPMYPNLTEAQVHRVCDKIGQILSERAASKSGRPALVAP
jgi:dTDP-4-amino-4,6-dideoxygalactose transaminase